MAKESSRRVAVFQGNSCVPIEGDRGPVDFEAFVEIFCRHIAVGSQIFSTFDTLGFEIVSARGAKTS